VGETAAGARAALDVVEHDLVEEPVVAESAHIGCDNDVESMLAVSFDVQTTVIFFASILFTIGIFIYFI